MTQPATPEERKRRIKTTFDSLASDYEGLRFVHVCATRLLELASLHANLTEGARVLDVATGTGLVALAAAHIVGPPGYVIGVDFSEQMLEKARAKLAQTELHNVQFVQGDAEMLEFSEAIFDTVLCASSLFFVPDMTSAAREFHRVLKPGARAGFSSFGTGFLEPVTSLLTARLEAHGVPPANPPVSRLADPDICRGLLEDAGFVDVTVISEQLGYHHHNFESRWAEIMAGLEGVPVSRLPAELRERVKDEYRADIAPLFAPDKLWLDVPANFVFGTKPATA